MSATDVDTTKTIENWIRAHDAAKLAMVAPRLKEALNARNKTIFWRALIDRAGEMAAKKAAGSYAGDPMACVKAMLAGGLPLDFQMEKGESPIYLALERSPAVGRAFIKLRPNLNTVDRADLTPLLFAVKNLKTQAPTADGLAVVGELASSGGVEWRFKDQGAKAFFDLLPLIAQMAASCELEGLKEVASQTIQGFVKNGFDINAPRGMGVSNDAVRIHTPLAYFIKKMGQWHSLTGCLGIPEVSQMVSCLVETLLENGADPCLQMETTERMALMDVCRGAGFPAGLAERLESSALLGATTKKAESAPAKGRSRL